MNQYKGKTIALVSTQHIGQQVRDFLRPLGAKIIIVSDIHHARGLRPDYYCLLFNPRGSLGMQEAARRFEDTRTARVIYDDLVRDVELMKRISKNNPDYRIVKIEVHRAGTCVSTSYRVQRCERFLFFTSWKTYKNIAGNYFSEWDEPVFFKSAEDAQDFIEQISKNPEAWTSSVTTAIIT